MTFAFYFIVCLLLVIIRTTIFPIFASFDNFFDLYLPVIVYFGLFRSAYETIPMVVILGIVMDSLSGVPFGLHLTSYVWLFLGVFWLKQFLHVFNYFLLSLIMMLGVVIENVTLAIVVNLFNTKWHFLPAAGKVILFQILFAVILGPPAIIFIRYLHEKWNKRINIIFSRDGDEFD